MKAETEVGTLEGTCPGVAACEQTGSEYLSRKTCDNSSCPRRNSGRGYWGLVSAFERNAKQIRVG